LGRMGVGAIPVVGDAVDLYEALTGKDFMTGEDLSDAQRYLSLFGVFIGSGQMWRQTAAGIEKEIADAAFKGRIKEAAENFAKGKNWKKGIVAEDRIIMEREGSEVNDQLRKQFPDPEKYQNSYKLGSKVYERITVEEEEYVRVYTDGKITGEWVVKKSEIKGLTPAQMKKTLALKDTPTHWATVKIPAGTEIREGIVAQNEFGKGGGRQTEILSDLKNDWYSDSKPIKE